MLVALLFFLITTHALMDYALQSDAIATCKCRKFESPVSKAVPWYYWLSAHAILHGASIGAVVRWFGFDWTAVATLALAETVLHWFIDLGKCERLYGIDIDQAFHVICRLAWFALLAGEVFGPLPPG
jgi:hypothetical protein